MELSMPHNNWWPRPHQFELWDFLVNKGGKRAMAVWHRRAGKDEVCLHATAWAMLQRPGNYWHCLPEYAQARRAIWTAVNPHTGKRRIDEAFPHELRANTNDHEMFIRFHNGSTFSCIGSDSYDRVVGSSAAGCVFSEFALSNPSAWAYMRPMLEENDGWAVFITTPRGRNHAFEMSKHAALSPAWFYQLQTARDTGALSEDQLDEALSEYRALYGQEQGEALYRQEYLCDWQSALLGSFYSEFMAAVRKEGRILECEPIETEFVHTSFDIGVGDDTSIWWFQPQPSGQLLILDHYSASGQGVEHYRDVIFERNAKRGWRHGHDFVPHDANVREWGTGRSRVETMQAIGLNPMRVPMASLDDGINAVRRTLPLCVFHPRTEEGGISALEQYRREWDDEKKCFKPTAVHDWTSHPCFTGDTEVLTRHGTQRIDELPQTGEVLTPCGWKQYHSPRVTRSSAPIVEVQFTDGLTVRCTPDHRFKTVSGWKSAASLTKGSQIQSSLTLSRSISMAAYTAFGRVKSISRAVARNCIATFGQGRLETSLAGVTSITETVTQPITNSTTLNVSQRKSTWLLRLRTAEKIGRQEAGLQTEHEMLPPTGIDRKRVGCGTNGMPSEQKAGSNGSAKKSPAPSVGSYLTRWFARAGLHRFTAILTVKPLRIERVVTLDQCEAVYCLTVPGEEAFSLVNGAVVHNCDSFRYLAQAWRSAPRRPVAAPKQEGWVIPPPREHQRGGIHL